MPTCGHCGEEVASSAKFCPGCGTAVHSVLVRPQQSRKTVTIVFSDLVDSTSLGEELDAESLREVMDDYFEAMQTVLERYGGVVEKFIGDAVMAVFGLPRMHEDDAIRAVRAAVGMRDELAVINQRLSNSAGITLRSRTGINTGVVVVGDSAGSQRLATGDAVNVAARLEQASPVGGITLGPGTFRLVKDFVAASPIGFLNLKGKSEPINAWELLALEHENERTRSMLERPLVGRQHELLRIEACLDAASRDGGAEFILVVGEPGVGKSRLAKAVEDRLATKAKVLRAECRPYGRPSLWPITELLSRVPEPARDVDYLGLQKIATEARLEDRDPIVERVASLLGLTEATYPLQECFWATARIFASVASRRPLVVVVEDLQWAEKTLLDLLDHLRANPRPAGILILATARSEALDQHPRFGEGIGDSQIIRLSPLSSEESDDLMRAELGTSLPANVRAVLHRGAGGNPLFLKQVLAMWLEDGVLVPGASGWAVARPVTEVRFPASVSAIFAARVDRLSDEQRLVLGAAAVAGATIDRGALQPMLAHLPTATLENSLQRLLDSGLLLTTSSEVHELAFQNASLRDVAYEMTLKRDRAAFHERLGLWHANRDDTSQVDGLVGHHLAEAYRYRTELRQADARTTELAVLSVHHLLADCERALRIGDRPRAERASDHIVEIVAASGQDIGATNLKLMEQTAKLLVTMGRWREAVTLLSPHVTLGHGPLMRDLGVALCQLHRSEPRSPEYAEGQRLLEMAGAPPRRDIDALASLAGTWKGVDDARAQALYRRCLDLDPADPYALGNVLEHEVAVAGDLAIVADMQDQITDASRRCRSQADAGLNLPWAFFDAGKFALLLGRPYDAIAAYSKAVQLATADHMIVTTLASLQRLAPLGGTIAGSSWAHDLLELARAVWFRSDGSLPRVGEVTPVPEVDEHTRVLMLAGGTDAAADEWLERHRSPLIDSLLNFDGLIVSGGTDNGVAGLAGLLRERYGERITALGYLPAAVPPGTTIDDRYDYLRRTAGVGFSIAESLQAWADLIASGVNPATVRLLAVNGGMIAAAEYRVALALGCTVGVINKSGREADRLLEDRDWVAAPNLVRLGLDVEAIRRFLPAER